MTGGAGRDRCLGPGRRYQGPQRRQRQYAGQQPRRPLPSHADTPPHIGDFKHGMRVWGKGSVRREDRAGGPGALGRPIARQGRQVGIGDAPDRPFTTRHGRAGRGGAGSNGAEHSGGDDRCGLSAASEDEKCLSPPPDEYEECASLIQTQSIFNIQKHISASAQSNFPAAYNKKQHIISPYTWPKHTLNRHDSRVEHVIFNKSFWHGDIDTRSVIK